jgi:hypothetical protein
MMGFKTFESARKLIAGIETMHMIKVSRFAATEHQPAHATVVYRRGDEFLVGSLVSRVAGSRHENRQPDQEAVPDRPSLVAIFQEA